VHSKATQNPIPVLSSPWICCSGCTVLCRWEWDSAEYAWPLCALCAVLLHVHQLHRDLSAARSEPGKQKKKKKEPPLLSPLFLPLLTSVSLLAAPPLRASHSALSVVVAVVVTVVIAVVIAAVGVAPGAAPVVAGAAGTWRPTPWGWAPSTSPTPGTRCAPRTPQVAPSPSWGLMLLEAPGWLTCGVPAARGPAPLAECPVPREQAIRKEALTYALWSAAFGGERLAGPPELHSRELGMRGPTRGPTFSTPSWLGFLCLLPFSRMSAPPTLRTTATTISRPCSR